MAKNALRMFFRKTRHHPSHRDMKPKDLSKEYSNKLIIKLLRFKEFDDIFLNVLGVEVERNSELMSRSSEESNCVMMRDQAIA